MPFGKFKNMEDCEKKMKKKEIKSPGGYCATVHKRITGMWPSQLEKYVKKRKRIKTKIKHL